LETALPSVGFSYKQTVHAHVTNRFGRSMTVQA